MAAVTATHPFHRVIMAPILQLRPTGVHWHPIFLLVPVALDHSDGHFDGCGVLAESLIDLYSPGLSVCRA